MLESLSPTAVLGSSAMSLAGGLWSNRLSEIEAQRNRDFQNNMSSSAHQREVQDLIAAGLNPVLSAGGGGAATGSGASASYSDPVTPAVNTGMQARANDAQVDLLKSQDVKTKAEAAVTAAQLPGAIAESTAKERSLNLQQLEIDKQSVLKHFFGAGEKALKKFDPLINHLLGLLPDFKLPSSSAKSVVRTSDGDYSSEAPWWLKAIGVDYGKLKSGTSGGASAKGRTGSSGSW